MQLEITTTEESCVIEDFPEVPLHPETVRELKSRAAEGLESVSLAHRHETGMCFLCFRDATPTVEGMSRDTFANGHTIHSSLEVCRECLTRMLILCDNPSLELYNGVLKEHVDGGI